MLTPELLLAQRDVPYGRLVQLQLHRTCPRTDTQGVDALTERNLVTVAGTCNHNGHSTCGFANLQFRKGKEGVTIDPHVTGACTVTIGWAEIPKVLGWLNELTVA